MTQRDYECDRVLGMRKSVCMFWEVDKTVCLSSNTIFNYIVAETRLFCFTHMQVLTMT